MHNIITKKVGLNRILAGGVKGPTAPVAGTPPLGSRAQKDASLYNKRSSATFIRGAASFITA
mgnify:CR=1 FL=1